MGTDSHIIEQVLLIQFGNLQACGTITFTFLNQHSNHGDGGNVCHKSLQNYNYYEVGLHIFL